MTQSSRVVAVPHRDLPLTERDHEQQVARGLYTIERGERLAIPVDRLADRSTFKGRRLWQQLESGEVARVGIKLAAPHSAFQGRALAFLRDHVDQRIPHAYYLAVLGHDVHTSQRGELYGAHFHAGWANPFDPDRLSAPLDPTFQTLVRTHFVAHECRLGAQCPARIWPSKQAMLSALAGVMGFTEQLGLLSTGKVTTAFRNDEAAELAAQAHYQNYKYHEVGTSAQAEANTDTALITTTSIARATGTQVNVGSGVYRSVGTITADTTETWQEHGLFSASTSTVLMDRSLTGGQSVASPDQVAYTYELTKTAEA